MNTDPLRSATVESVGGIHAADPFRVMEDTNNSRVHDWINDQAVRAWAYLDSLSERSAFAARIAELKRVETPFVPIGSLFPRSDSGSLGPESSRRELSWYTPDGYSLGVTQWRGTTFGVSVVIHQGLPDTRKGRLSCRCSFASSAASSLTGMRMTWMSVGAASLGRSRTSTTAMMMTAEVDRVYARHFRYLDRIRVESAQ